MTTRALGFLGLSSLFLIISPKIRQILLDDIGSTAHQFELHAPCSYVIGVALVFLVLMVSLYRGAQPR
jgi:hypothetical protein